MTLDELQEKIDSIPWWKRLYYSFLRGLDTIKDFPREVKWFYQRGRRGYADCDVWGLHSYLSEWLPKALRQLAENNVGCPCDLYDHEAPKGKECHKWEAILTEIAEGFEASLALENMDYFDVVKKAPRELTDKDMEKVNRERRRLEGVFNRGMRLFTKHYFGLWD